MARKKEEVLRIEAVEETPIEETPIGETLIEDTPIDEPSFAEKIPFEAMGESSVEETIQEMAVLIEETGENENGDEQNALLIDDAEIEQKMLAENLAFYDPYQLRDETNDSIDSQATILNGDAAAPTPEVMVEEEPLDGLETMTDDLAVTPLIDDSISETADGALEGSNTALTEPTDTLTEPARARRTRRSRQVLSIDDQARTPNAQDAENLLWLELRNAQRTRRILKGTLSGIERLENGLPLAIVYYKEMRVAIPATEMMLRISAEGQTEQQIYNRYAQLLTRMLSAEIDFIIAGLDRKNEVVLASRQQAMLRKQQRYYLSEDNNGDHLVEEGRIAEARIISVGEKSLRVEVLGVETNITAKEMAWEWIDDANHYFQVGQRVLVKVLTVHRDAPENLRITASIRQATENPSAANLKKCVNGGKYIGTVTGIDNVVFVRLNIGVNAIATTVRDPRAVCVKDEVSFVATRIDEANGLAVGIITRIIKQASY